VDWKGRVNPLVEAVQAISIDGRRDEEKSLAELELEVMRGPQVAADWRDDPRNADNRNRKPDGDRLVKYGPADDDVIPAWVIEGDDVAADRNRSGSFESLRAGWGNSGRQAFEVPS
jgi:hypothetical protein